MQIDHSKDDNVGNGNNNKINIVIYLSLNPFYMVGSVLRVSHTLGQSTILALHYWFAIILKVLQAHRLLLLEGAWMTLSHLISLLQIMNNLLMEGNALVRNSVAGQSITLDRSGRNPRSIRCVWVCILADSGDNISPMTTETIGSAISLPLWL